MTDVTKVNAQEERLRHLASLLDCTEDAIVAFDADWCVAAWSTGAERMYGWAADEVLGLHPVEIALETGRAGTRGATTVYRKDGTPLGVEVTTIAVGDGYLSIHRDVSERDRTAQALREARRRSDTVLRSIREEFFAIDRQWRFTYLNGRGLARIRDVVGRDLAATDLVGVNLWEFLPALMGTTFDREAHRALRERTTADFEMCSPLGFRWVEVSVHPSDAGLSIYVRDISERKRAEEELSRRADQQQTVAELGRRALASDDLQAVLDEAVELLARTLDVELACVAEMPAGSEDLILRAGTGWRGGYIGRRFERGRGDSQARYTLLRGEPVIAADQARDPRFKRSALAGEHGVVSALTVMIASPAEPFGVLEALSTRRRRFSQGDVNFAQAVANVLASAVERSRTERRLNEVRELERKRIARDLHDEALQGLTEALALATTAELTVALRRVGEQLRAALYDLRLDDERETPFRELVESLVAVQRSIAPGCAIDVDIGDGVPASTLGATGIETLRILGEALTNARRHSGARTVRIRIWAEASTLHAVVADDGHGFDPAARRPGLVRHGLAGMRERAALLHGRLDIRSGPATGTTVRLEVPLQPHRRAGERVRTLLVEDHTAVRQALAAMLEREADFAVAGQARSLGEARELLRDVDVAVLDLRLPDGDGLELLPALREASPGAQALVLSANLTRAQTARAIEAGAAGALDKTADLDQIVDGIRRLRAGQTLLTRHEVVELLAFASRRRERQREDRAAIATLTEREREVLEALAAGCDAEMIAGRLGISIRTERNHVARILNKLGVHTQLQAVLFALRYELVGGLGPSA